MLTDTDPMPFGRYQGDKMQDVPVHYLHWCWHNISPKSYEQKEVIEYITTNMNALRMEAKDLLWQKT